VGADEADATAEAAQEAARKTLHTHSGVGAFFLLLQLQLKKVHLPLHV